MLATQILSQDHQLAMSLIEGLEGVRSDERGNREKFQKLRAALELHMREEEEIYYPAVAELEGFAGLIDENVAEHAKVRENLGRMSELSPADAIFQTTLTELKIALEAHVEEEETRLFPRSVELLGDERMRELGNQIDQLKSDEGHTRSAGI